MRSSLEKRLQLEADLEDTAKRDDLQLKMICMSVRFWSRMNCSERTLRWWLEPLTVVSLSTTLPEMPHVRGWADNYCVWKPFLFFGGSGHLWEREEEWLHSAFHRQLSVYTVISCAEGPKSDWASSSGLDAVPAPLNLLIAVPCCPHCHCRTASVA